MNNKMTFFIGANNKTKRLELNKIENIFSKYLEGFTLIKNIGYWLKQKEHSAEVITLNLNELQKQNIVIDLKKELQQNSILVLTENPKIEFL